MPLSMEEVLKDKPRKHSIGDPCFQIVMDMYEDV